MGFVILLSQMARLLGIEFVWWLAKRKILSKMAKNLLTDGDALTITLKLKPT